MEYNVGDIVRTKKQHPCGSKLWEITRVGIEFKLKCQGCGHIVVLDRPKALKAITKIEKKALKNCRKTAHYCAVFIIYSIVLFKILYWR